MTDRTTDERIDERRIEYEYRAEVPVVPPVGTTDTGPDASRITGAPELAETPGRPERTGGGPEPTGGRREAGR